ncbi:hypothetical protein AVEN_267294-1 [Araneus ventricosus]|uniref:Uncharacterized protein n=1 Tax=Araneus ventricosus TaxID=182803 RepID=A0A4Y2DLM4_ARAVE|nr:hypothetical protein AVEN_267294-1 [Araneus ventricosus]
MPTPVPWPAALDYAVEDPWREQPDRSGPTDSRLGLNPNVLYNLWRPHTPATPCIMHAGDKGSISHMHRCNRSGIFRSVTCLLGKRCLYTLSASKSFPFARPYIKCMSAFS